MKFFHFRIEVLEIDDDEPYVYEFATWEEVLERITRFDGIARSYTITREKSFT